MSNLPVELQMMRLPEAKVNELIKLVDENPVILKMRADAFERFMACIHHSYQLELKEDQAIHDIDMDINNKELRWAYLKGRHEGMLDTYNTIENLTAIINNEIVIVHNHLIDPLVRKAFEEENGHE